MVEGIFKPTISTRGQILIPDLFQDPDPQSIDKDISVID